MLRRHLLSCESCRREYDETNLLISGMVASRDRILEGHISSNLLYQFVQTPQALEPETIELINTHLSLCDRCQEDSANIKQLILIDSETDAAVEKHRRPSFWRKLFHKRLVPAYSILAVILIAAVALLFRQPDTSLLSFAQVVSQAAAEKSGYKIFTLENSITPRGDDASPSRELPVISKGVDKHMVLSIEAVTFEDEKMSYLARITSSDGTTVWESDLDKAYLESGTLWLILDHNDFEIGVFRLIVLEHEGDYQASISTGLFEVVE